MTETKQFQIGSVQVEVTPAPALKFASNADCNSPCWWDKQGKFHVLTSTGHPRHSEGSSVEQMTAGDEITYTAWRDGGRWIESVYQEPNGNEVADHGSGGKGPDGNEVADHGFGGKGPDGTLLGWYHNEPAHYIPDEYQVGRQFPMTAPFIGAVVSYDNGMTWDDLGLVLTGAHDTLNLERRNFFFAGGNGDFTVILDQKKEYFYFLFGTYYKDVAQQGISLARMRYEDRFSPVGRVWKWRDGAWQEPGLNGAVSPVIPVRADWYSEGLDAFWGPSAHWNTALGQYVILINRAIDPKWAQEGIYLSLATDLGDPASWTEPLKILDERGWYPQVVGLDFAKRETDREAGEQSRLFIHGESKYMLRFSRISE